MSFLQYMVAPMIVFLVVVAPLWIIMHYRSKSKMSQGLSSDELSNMEEILSLLDKLTGRIETLEKILDSDHKGWRDQSRG